MDNKKKEVTEADIIINGHTLTFAESATVRVALTSLSFDCKISNEMESMYKPHIRTINKYILEKNAIS